MQPIDNRFYRHCAYLRVVYEFFYSKWATQFSQFSEEKEIFDAFLRKMYATRG